jgi:ER-bound oxygenase mpaB/B'/Rubber oxygenase, catalytic domain
MRPIKPTRAFTQTWLDTCRQQGDIPADALVESLVCQGGLPLLRQVFGWLTQPPSVLCEVSEVENFIEKQVQENPVQLDAVLGQGLDFFATRQADIALLLGCLSLPYCYAAADGAQVLYLSERIKNDTAKRLEETGEFVFEVMKKQNWEKGIAQRRILKVRLMHAAIRYFSVQSGKWQPAWGLPINQEDMAGTNLAFSYLIIRGLRKTGKSPETAEAEAYLHSWNKIGLLLGLHPDLLPQNLREAFRLDQQIARRHFRPSEAGQALTQSLVKALSQFVPNPLLKQIPAANMRFLLGDEIADMLGLPALTLETKIVPFIPFALLFENNPQIPS